MNLTEHYSDGSLRDRLFAVLPENLTVEVLAPFDEFHIRGLEASRDLIDLAEITPHDKVLDIGSGVGGPARFIAHTTGAHVTGIDLTPEYVALATELSAKLNLADRTTFQVANALSLPFADQEFDIVWMQHMNMNIADKLAMYREAARVLKPNGKLILHEVLLLKREGASHAGESKETTRNPMRAAVASYRRSPAPEPEIHYPTPWATDKSQSHLTTEEDLKTTLTEAGFKQESWQVDTQNALDWFEKSKGQQNKIGTHLIFGDRSKELFRNIYRNLAEGKIAVVMAVLQRG